MIYTVLPIYFQIWEFLKLTILKKLDMLRRKAVNFVGSLMWSVFQLFSDQYKKI